MAVLLPNAAVRQAKMRGYRIFVWSHDHPHPPHVHVRKGTSYSTWLLPELRCIDPGDFDSSEIRAQSKLLREFHAELLRSWHDHWQNQEGRRR